MKHLQKIFNEEVLNKKVINESTVEQVNDYKNALNTALIAIEDAQESLKSTKEDFIYLDKIKSRIQFLIDVAYNNYLS